jgi:hypothetical protein
VPIRLCFKMKKVEVWVFLKSLPVTTRGDADTQNYARSI